MQIDHTKKIIEFKNVTFSYDQENAVENVNLEVHRGDYMGIIGPNGGGKSTILKLMLGIIRPVSGEIRLYGKDLSEFNDWMKIGYVSQQEKRIDPNFPITVEEVVRMGRYAKIGLLNFFQKRDEKFVKEALENVEIWNLRKKLISDLSGGQLQRVFIARALCSQPEILILDEPTVGVDAKTQKQFYSLLQKLNKENELTLILVSHELDVVAHEATEIAYINCNLIYYGIPQNFAKSSYFTALYGEHTNV